MPAIRVPATRSDRSHQGRTSTYEALTGYGHTAMSLPLKEKAAAGHGCSMRRCGAQENSAGSSSPDHGERHTAHPPAEWDAAECACMEPSNAGTASAVLAAFGKSSAF